MVAEQLIEKLRELEKAPTAEWQSRLAPRKLAEKEFADARLEKAALLPNDIFEEMYSNQKFYSVVEESTKYVDDWIKNESKGKIVLDYACGRGGYAIKAALAGAELAIGIDISPVSIQVARECARAAKVEENTYFLFGDAERTGLPDAGIDIVICAGMLHHLDLSYALPELRRIMHPGGKIIALEALDYNPIIKLYRLRTPNLRTEWEKAHILSLKDIRFAERFFDIGRVKYFHIATIAEVYLPGLKSLLSAADRLLCAVPGIRLFSWMFCFELIRRND